MNHRINTLIRPWVIPNENEIGYHYAKGLKLRDIDEIAMWNYRCIYCISRFSYFLTMYPERCLHDTNFHYTGLSLFTRRMVERPFYV